MRWTTPLFVSLLAGCASTSTPPAPATGQVGVRDVTAGVPSADRLSLAANETFQPPLPHPGNTMPSYPQALLAQRLPPQAVCVQVGVGEDGGVIGTAVAPSSADCPDAATPVARSFFAAAAAAAATWRFEPAFRCVFERTPAPGEGCGHAGTHEAPQAVSLVYRFVFEQVDGRGTVRLGD